MQIKIPVPNKKDVIKTSVLLGSFTSVIIVSSVYFKIYKWTYRTPIIFQSPIVVEKLTEEVMASEVEEAEEVVEPTPTPKPKTVEDIIKLEWGTDASIGLKIAFCESTNRPEAKNTNSSATGLFQFINSTWIETRNRMKLDPSLNLRLDPTENAKTAYFLYQLKGTQPWLSSRNCWEVK
jgi:hypothetical protein